MKKKFKGEEASKNNTITDGGVAPQCSFARPTRNTENTDSQRTLRNKKLDQGTLGMSDPLQLTFDQLGTDRTS